jgi:hypothetical protein
MIKSTKQNVQVGGDLDAQIETETVSAGNFGDSTLNVAEMATAKSNARKRLPPFGKAILEARQRGIKPRKMGLGHVVVNLHWKAPRAGMTRIVIPRDLNPADASLHFLAGLHCTLIYRRNDAARVQAAIDALLAAGATPVDVVNFDALKAGASLDACWPRFEQEGVGHAA